MIYCIGNQAQGICKIGFTTNVAQRVANLQIGSPYKLEILGTLEGDMIVERALHTRFQNYHMNGEWFSLAPEICKHFGYTPEASFTKFYAAGISALCGLNAPARKVLSYVCQNLRPDNAVVWMKAAHYIAQMGFNKASYYSGLDELIATNFLSSSNQKGFYFVNPAFIFNGNRLAMKHEFIKPVKSR